MASPGVTPIVEDTDLGDKHTFTIVTPPAHGTAIVITDDNVGRVRLTWREVNHPRRVGYRLYYGLSSGNYTSSVDVGNQTAYTLSGLQGGETYYFAITSYDTLGGEGVFSKELVYQVPRVNQLMYTPHPDFFGADSFTYRATDTGGESIIGTAQVNITPVNDAPVAVDDTVATAEDTPVTTGNVLANDTDVDGDSLNLIGFTRAFNGTVVSHGDGTFTYTPFANFHGTDRFTYTIADGHGLTATATVNITVTAVNDAPVATDMEVTTMRNIAVLIYLNGIDTDGDLLTFAVTTAPTQGTLSGSPPNLTYTPNPNFAGTDHFTYTVTDTSGLSATATVTVRVIAVIDGLVAAYGFDEGNGTTAFDLSGLGNNGNIIGATWTTQGRFGSALSLDGVSNFVSINPSPSLDLTNGMTLEAWVYPTAVFRDWRTIVVKEFLYYLYASSDAGGPITGVFINNNEESLYSGSSLEVNTWTHLAATYDGVTQRLYINGFEVANRLLTGQIQVANRPAGIGGNLVAGEFFQGLIDEVLIYNRVLSAAEIQRDMQRPVVSVDTDGDGLTDFDERHVYGTDPEKADTDGDRVPDGEEVAWWGTRWDEDLDGDGVINLLDPDTDGDGYLDGLELHYGTDPGDPTSVPPVLDLLEVGEVELDTQCRWVPFRVPFFDPVVVVTSLSQRDPEPAVVRICTITPTGFSVRVQEWDYLDGVHGRETVSYLVLERGRHRLADGRWVEADYFTTDKTKGGESVVFQQPFPTVPVVWATISTTNEAEAVAGRVFNVQQRWFQYRLQEQQANVPQHAAESVAYVAWEVGTGVIRGLRYEVGRTAMVVQNRWSRIPYVGPWGEGEVVLTEMQTLMGLETATVRVQGRDSTGVTVRIAEEQSLTASVWHRPEVVGYLVISVQR
jgi:hypothetical protein